MIHYDHLLAYVYIGDLDHIILQYRILRVHLCRDQAKYTLLLAQSVACRIPM